MNRYVYMILLQITGYNAAAFCNFKIGLCLTLRLRLYSAPNKDIVVKIPHSFGIQKKSTRFLCSILQLSASSKDEDNRMLIDEKIRSRTHECSRVDEGNLLPQRRMRLEQAASERMEGLRVVLDGVGDPRNRAAVSTRHMRSAAAFAPTSIAPAFDFAAAGRSSAPARPLGCCTFTPSTPATPTSQGPDMGPGKRLRITHPASPVQNAPVPC